MHDKGALPWGVPFLHASMAATLYVLWRESSFLPWLWPLDDALWVVAGLIVIIAWRPLAKRLSPLAAGATASAITCGLAGFVLAVLFYVFTQIMQRKGVGVGGAPFAALIFGVALLGLAIAGFKLMVATLAAGLIAGGLAQWRRNAVRPLILVLAALAAIIPIDATWSHAALGIGIEDWPRCSQRLSDPLVPGLDRLKPKGIFVGDNTDCHGERFRGGSPAPSRVSN